MAEENIYKQEFNVRNLLTRSVTLYPSRAQITRDIDEITLKPGTNEITIYGVTPTADESSIKVDGKGPATITDMMVELIPNKENYDDVYSSDSDDEDAGDSNDEQAESDTESDKIKPLEGEVKKITDAIRKVREEENSATSRLEMLESYGRSLEKDRPKDLEACMRAYREERQKTFEVLSSSEDQIKALGFEYSQLLGKQVKAIKAAAKEQVKARKEKAKLAEKKRRARQEKLDTKRRIKDERIEFWPRKIFRVVLTLETNSDLTPASSRRESIDSLAKPLPEFSPGSCQISLSLSYITSSAFWLPRYDLSLNTPTRSGVLVYRAEFCNTTSETWKDAKVILSTSQTSFQGLGEPIPFLTSWHIRLSKMAGSQTDSSSGALVSTHEMEYKRKVQVDTVNKISEPRHMLFGLDRVTPPPAPQQQQLQQQQQMQRQQPQIQQMQIQPMQPMQQMQQQQAQQQQAQQQQMQMQQMQQQQPQILQMGGHGPSNLFQGNLAVPAGYRWARRPAIQATEDDLSGGNAETIIPDVPELATQESTWAESGLTATYDIPGLRTISPSHTARRQKIASISLKDIQLLYVMVPKLRAAAFLKARFRNTSSIALLKGQAGLTLDGSFLGNTNVPRCSAGEAFSLSLGVDPSVTVTYSKPVVKRRETGVFQKEGNGVYTRVCTITNTKSNRALEGAVHDQVPVSEDERLKVEVIQPSGLRNEGDVAKTGTPIVQVGKTAEKWGKATATMRKGGEICWDVKLEPGRSVKLVLEYEARFPSHEVVVSV
ncbi:hypothetical protein JMJ35_003761 [Cladonia borealis]|uniref:Mucoidy inhibitor-like protein n=1 Tax=Cladonia borealis TaxID=184061 RepID=A0AA39R5I9_9LECA|nr:hypothetical protein JMJ35_003761 [Cladonia borealis]